MAPEVLLGSLPDFRADVFSLGVVLYEMLGGRHPFLASTPTAIAMQIVQQEATPLDKVSHSVPPPLALIVAKALEKKPDERYQSPRELAADLRAVRFGSRPQISAAREFSRTTKLESLALREPCFRAGSAGHFCRPPSRADFSWLTPPHRRP